MSKAKVLVLLLIVLIGAVLSFKPTYADELEDVEEKIEETSKKLDDLTKEKNDLEERIEELTSNLSATQADLNYITGEIAKMEEKLNQINLTLEQKRKDLADKIDLRNRVVRAYYQSSLLNGLEFFLLSFEEGVQTSDETSGFQQISQSYIAHKTLTQNALTAIGHLNTEISL